MRPVPFTLTAVLCLVGLRAHSADAPANGAEVPSRQSIISPYPPNAAVEAATKALSVAQENAARAERDLIRRRALKEAVAAGPYR